jgi:hypothetical protein
MCSWVAAAVVGGAVVGGVITADASRSAAHTQADAANRATDLQGQQFQQTQRNLMPYMNTGEAGNTRLAEMLGIGGNPNADGYGSLNQQFQAQPMDFYKDPGYQFQLDQGMHALQNSQAAKDGVLSGAALKDLIGFNQGMANTAYQNYFDRYQAGTMNDYNRFMGQKDATFNRLASVLGIGENAAAGVGNVGAQTAASMANTMTSGAAASAAGTVGAANAITGGINNGLGYYMMNNLSNGKLFGTGSGSSVPQSVINMANSSSDPIAAMNGYMGWTGPGV